MGFGLGLLRSGVLGLPELDFGGKQQAPPNLGIVMVAFHRRRERGD
jgi:hypothetical protein